MVNIFYSDVYKVLDFKKFYIINPFWSLWNICRNWYSSYAISEIILIWATTVAVIYKINLGRDLARLDVWTDAFTKTGEFNDINSSQIPTKD